MTNWRALVSTHSHPKVAACPPETHCQSMCVSTHSHPKVAATAPLTMIATPRRFNTQPPEGGCPNKPVIPLTACVSTHSHPKVAAKRILLSNQRRSVSTHSHPKVAAPNAGHCKILYAFQHTATRRWLPVVNNALLPSARFQHTATRRWLPSLQIKPSAKAMFQHTATRRWLRPIQIRIFPLSAVSTHSHPKVAAVILRLMTVNLVFQHTATRRWLLPS